jgi:hypothetical protein
MPMTSHPIRCECATQPNISITTIRPFAFQAPVDFSSSLPIFFVINVAAGTFSLCIGSTVIAVDINSREEGIMSIKSLLVAAVIGLSGLSVSGCVETTGPYYGGYGGYGGYGTYGGYGGYGGYYGTTIYSGFYDGPRYDRRYRRYDDRRDYWRRRSDWREGSERRDDWRRQQARIERSDRSRERTDRVRERTPGGDPIFIPQRGRNYMGGSGRSNQ